VIKNTASQRIGGQMISATDGSAFTGAVTISVTVDAGVQATGSVGSGACVHEGLGYHSYAPAQAETNGELLAFTFTGSGAIPATVQVFTVAGDAFTRLGAPVGASLSADIAAVQADTDNVQTRLPAALVSGRIDASMGAVATGVIAAASFAANALDAVWSTAVRVLTAATNLTTALATPTNITAGTITTVGTLTTNSDKAGYAIGVGGIGVTAFAAGAIDASAIALDAIGASELSADAVTEIATAVLSAATSTPIAANVEKINDVALIGVGTVGNPWGPV